MIASLQPEWWHMCYKGAYILLFRGRLLGVMADDEREYAKLREAAADGPWGTCADGSERGKHSAKMQVPPTPPSNQCCMV